MQRRCKTSGNNCIEIIWYSMRFDLYPLSPDLWNILTKYIRCNDESSNKASIIIYINTWILRILPWGIHNIYTLNPALAYFIFCEIISLNIRIYSFFIVNNYYFCIKYIDNIICPGYNHTHNVSGEQPWFLFVQA